VEKYDWCAHNEVSAASGASESIYVQVQPHFADIEIMRSNCGGSEKIGPTASERGGNAALVRVAHDLGGLTGNQ